MPKLNLFFILLLFFVLEDSYAIDCNEGGDTTLEMKECAEKELGELTKKINSTYNSYRKKLDKKQQDDLKSVQLAWIKYKDLRCKFETSFYEGGTMAGLVWTSCLSSITKQRLREFEDALKEQASR